jgi:hypothetical protein
MNNDTPTTQPEPTGAVNAAPSAPVAKRERILLIGYESYVLPKSATDAEVATLIRLFDGAKKLESSFGSKEYDFFLNGKPTVTLTSEIRAIHASREALSAARAAAAQAAPDPYAGMVTTPAIEGGAQ